MYDKYNFAYAFIHYTYNSFKETYVLQGNSHSPAVSPTGAIL
jgi:hypothetical protein